MFGMGNARRQNTALVLALVMVIGLGAIFAPEAQAAPNLSVSVASINLVEGVPFTFRVSDSGTMLATPTGSGQLTIAVSNSFSAPNSVSLVGPGYVWDVTITALAGSASSGTITIVGTDSLDSSVNRTQTVTIPVTITAAPVAITPTSLPSGTINKSYTQQLYASGSTSYSFSVPWGSLPPGLTLSNVGLIKGTPTSTGSYSFMVRATSGTQVGERTYTLTINSSSGSGGSGGSGGSSGGSGPSYHPPYPSYPNYPSAPYSRDPAVIGSASGISETPTVIMNVEVEESAGEIEVTE